MIKRAIAPLAGLLALAMTSQVFADAKPIMTQDWRARAAVLGTHHANDYVIGLFPGSVDIENMVTSVARFLPFMNYLSATTGDLYSYVQERSPASIKEDIAAKRYRVMYLSPDLAVVAVQHGYKPIVQRTRGIATAFVVRKDSPVQTLQDANGKTWGVVPKVLIDTIARDYLNENNIHPKDSEQMGDFRNQMLVVSALTGAQSDGTRGAPSIEIAGVRKDIAEAMIKRGDPLRIIGSTPEVPGFMMVFDPEQMSIGDAQKLKVSMMGLREGVHENVLVGLESDKFVKEGFKPYKSGDLEGMAQILKRMYMLQNGK